MSIALRSVLPVGSVLCCWTVEECPEALLPLVERHDSPVMVALTSLDADLKSVLGVRDEQPVEFRSADGLRGVVWFCDLVMADGLVRGLELLEPFEVSAGSV